MGKLVETKGAFKVIGKVSRIDKEFAWKEAITEKGKREGDLYRSLKFGVKTSDTNEITVSMFDYEPTEVFLWNSGKREKDPSYKGEKIPFGTWEEQQDELREQGYAVLQTRVGLTYNEEGKIDSKGLPSFVASQEIYNNLDNGDSVVIEGKIRYGSYMNKNDEEVEQKTYVIEKAYKIKDVDFEAENFEEITYFEQQMVFVDIDIDKKEGKAYLTGRIIDYRENFHDTQMIITFKDDEGNLDNDMVKMIDTLKNKVKFGDVIKVYGDTLNRVILSEVEDDSKDEDLFAEFGGKAKPKHAQGFVARTYVTEMQIHGVDGWDKEIYTEEDFVKEELIDDNDSLKDFGGKPKKANPFETGEPIEISEDDLPF